MMLGAIILMRMISSSYLFKESTVAVNFLIDVGLFKSSRVR